MTEETREEGHQVSTARLTQQCDRPPWGGPSQLALLWTRRSRRLIHLARKLASARHKATVQLQHTQHVGVNPTVGSPTSDPVRILLGGSWGFQQQYRARDNHGRAADYMRNRKAGTGAVPT